MGLEARPWRTYILSISVVPLSVDSTNYHFRNNPSHSNPQTLPDLVYWCLAGSPFLVLWETQSSPHHSRTRSLRSWATELKAVSSQTMQLTAWLFCINHCRHGNTTIRAIYIVELHVALNNVEKLSDVTEMQQWLAFVLLSSYKPFQTAAKNIIFPKSPYKLADIVGRNLKTKCRIYWNKVRSSHCMRNLKKIRLNLPWYTQTDGRTLRS